MRIAFIDPLGLPYDGSTLEKRGLGGSESAVVRMAEQLSDLGHEVVVWNNCGIDDTLPGTYNNVVYQPLTLRPQGKFNVVIASRSTIPFVEEKYRLVDTRYRVLWMHDTFCQGDEMIEYLCNIGAIDSIFTLSDWHTTYVSTCTHHGVARDPAILKKYIWQTRNGINVKPRNEITLGDKKPLSFVYNASATKGLRPLIETIWPRIRGLYPQAELTVIGGYYKYREGAEPDAQQKIVEKYADSSPPGVTFTGVIKQDEISDILAKTKWMLYPSAFPETYGISTLEALAHNTPVITCERGALEEVAFDSACYKIRYPIIKDWSCEWLNEEQQATEFVNLVAWAIENEYIYQQKFHACNAVKTICDWSTVALQWHYKLCKQVGVYDVDVKQVADLLQIENDLARTFSRVRFDSDFVGRNYCPSNKSLGVVVTMRNAEQWIGDCIRSIAMQLYHNYHVYVIDDASTDRSAEAAASVINHVPTSDRFELWVNGCSQGALANQLDVFNNPTRMHDAWLIIDGDDRLAFDPFIFEMYNKLLHKYDIVYGSMHSVADNIDLFAQPYPDDAFKSKMFSDYRFPWNMPYTHLRGFNANLLDTIDMKRLNDPEGNVYRAGGDLALQYELFRQVSDQSNVYANPFVVYQYNDAHTGNDMRLNKDEQDRNVKRILNENSSRNTNR